jgi:hypothetical protein
MSGQILGIAVVPSSKGCELKQADVPVEEIVGCF